MLEATPAHIDLVEVASAIREVAGVRQVHDLHVWALTSRKYAMSGRVIVQDVVANDRILRELHAPLRGAERRQEKEDPDRLEAERLGSEY
ncbi:MAG: hypothetical protein M3550_13770 [Actinomycetota bacterium]|nr:hypothetical protein [Actinomycetota bacterium]